MTASAENMPATLESQAARIEALENNLRQVVNGFEVIEKALLKARRGHLGDAPMELDVNQARIYHSASASAYQHALEMCNSTTVTAFVNAGFVKLPAPALDIQAIDRPRRFRSQG